MSVQCRKADIDLVKTALTEAKAIYKSKVGNELNVTVDTAETLPDSELSYYFNLFFCVFLWFFFEFF